MNSLIDKNIENILRDSNHVPHISTHSAKPLTACRTQPIFTIYIVFLNMILMSEKMTSQTITEEFIFYVLFETM